MGKLVDGQWVKGSLINSDTEGAYDRVPRSFHDTIGDDHPEFKPQSGRYHLYVSYACPWAQRTLIFRELKGLASHISVDVVHPHLLEHGWNFASDFPGATGDSLYQSEYLYQIYQLADPQVSTTATVPILWDKQSKKIVNNESSEIIRILNNAFNHLTQNDDDYYPQSLRGEIDAWNEKIYHNVNNGVYRAGFAVKQSAYEGAVKSLFVVLDELEQHLENKSYLVGEQLTEADVRLITTLLRFDAVYHTHFKCNVRRLMDYKNLSRYAKSLYELDAVKSTTEFNHIKQHYYYSHPEINPHRIIPVGPDHLL